MLHNTHYSKNRTYSAGVTSTHSFFPQIWFLSRKKKIRCRPQQLQPRPSDIPGWTACKSSVLFCLMQRVQPGMTVRTLARADSKYCEIITHISKMSEYHNHNWIRTQNRTLETKIRVILCWIPQCSSSYSISVCFCPSPLVQIRHLVRFSCWGPNSNALSGVSRCFEGQAIVQPSQKFSWLHFSCIEAWQDIS